MHCRCGTPYEVSQKMLPLELYSNSFLLALTETDKQTFEMTGHSNSENVIGDAAKQIIFEWLWVGKMCLQL